MADFLEQFHIVPAFVSHEDAFDSDIDTESVSLENYQQATLVINTGAIEDSGISNLITMEASTDSAQTGATEMPFRWRVQPFASQSVDLWTALTEVASTGYNFAVNHAVANMVWYLTVTADEVNSALPGAEWVSAFIKETVNKTIAAGGIWILSNPRYGGAIPVGAIA